MAALTLKAVRVNAGYTQEEAAQKLGLKSVETLRNYERGETFPNTSVVSRMLELYDVKYEEVQWI